MEKTKIEKFVEEYGKLVAKHHVDFITFPQFVPDGNNGFRVICQTQPIDLDEQAKAKREQFIAKNV